MKYCSKCGAEISEGVKICPTCGAEIVLEEQPKNDFSEKVKNFNNTADTTREYSAEEISNGKVMAILAYFGPLVLITIFAAKDNRFARFHANQGLTILLASIAYSIAYSILSAILLAISWRLYFILTILSLVAFVIGIIDLIGLINAAMGKAKEVPLIGKFKFLK